MVYMVGSSSRFGGAILKIAKARKQLRDLNEEFRAYTERKLYDLRAEFSIHAGGDTGEFQYFVVEPSAMPWDWAITIGEIVHNLRSALDHAVYAAARRPSGKHQFPVFLRRADWDTKAGTMLRSVPVEVVSVIERVQPFHASVPVSHRLAILNYLSNRDKHRLLNTSVLALEGCAPGFRAVRGVSAVHDVQISGGPLEDGQRIAQVVVGVDGTRPELEMFGEFTHSVAFRDASARGRVIDGVPVIDVLGRMPRLIQDTIVRIEVICEPKPGRSHESA